MHPLRLTLVAAGLSLLAPGCSDLTRPLPGPAASVRIVSGAGQSGVVGTDLAKPVIVAVRDSSGRAVPGATILGSTLGTEVRLIGDSALTDANGRAALRWKLMTVSGRFEMHIEVKSGVVPAQLPPQTPWWYSPSVIDTITVVPGPLHHFTVFPHSFAPRFMGDLVLRDSIFSPRDTFENVRPWPAAPLQVTNGWQVVGDTLRPPAGLRASETVASVISGPATASLLIVLVEDLSKYNWHVTYTCTGPIASASSPPPADTVQYDLYSHQLVYKGFRGYIGPSRVPATNLAQIFFTSGTVRTVQGSQVSVADVAQRMVGYIDFPRNILDQRPDTLVLSVVGSGKTAADTASLRVPQSTLPKFVGGSWCDATRFSVRPPMTFEAY